MTRTVPALVLAVLMLCLAAVPAFAASPVDAFTQIQKGIDTKNAALVEKHLDLNAVISHGIDNAVKNPEVVRLASEYPPVAIMMALGGADSSAFKQFIGTEVRKFVDHGVASGAFAGKPDKNAGRFNGLLAALFRGGAGDQKVFRNAKTLKQSGKKALVAVKLFDASNGETYPLEMGLEQQKGVWRVVEISNIASLIGRMTTGAE